MSVRWIVTTLVLDGLIGAAVAAFRVAQLCHLVTLIADPKEADP